MQTVAEGEVAAGVAADVEVSGSVYTTMRSSLILVLGWIENPARQPLSRTMPTVSSLRWSRTTRSGAMPDSRTTSRGAPGAGRLVAVRGVHQGGQLVLDGELEQTGIRSGQPLSDLS